MTECQPSQTPQRRLCAFQQLMWRTSKHLLGCGGATYSGSGDDASQQKEPQQWARDISDNLVGIDALLE